MISECLAFRDSPQPEPATFKSVFFAPLLLVLYLPLLDKSSQYPPFVYCLMIGIYVRTGLGTPLRATI